MEQSSRAARAAEPQLSSTLMAAQPLVSLDAVVLDTETTGLDTRTARVLAIGAIRLKAGRLVEDDALSTLVDPGEPVSAASTAIHGISSAMLDGAPAFAQAFARLRGFAGDRVVIGHSIGFDLAVLRRECALAGLDWTTPRALDTSMLAQAANRRLPDASLETVAAWLGLELAPRHEALGDAISAGRIFLALLPHLRERNIRTLAEAEAACRAMSDALERQYRAGWVEPVAGRAGPAGPVPIDSYPYRHHVREVMRAPVVSVPREASLHEAMRVMTGEQVSSVLVTGGDEPGLITERDVLRAVSTDGAAALAHPADLLASRPVITVPADAFIYRALGRMHARRLRHLGVTDEFGGIVGMISARDLLRLRASEAIALGDEIDCAEDVPGLAAAWGRLTAVAESLVSEGIDARTIAEIISREMGAVTRRAAVFAEAEFGSPPAQFAVIMLGSGGRGESLLTADQDNALIYADEADEASAEAWFARFGESLADALNAAGVRYCPGGIMAKNAAWRGSAATWRARVENWTLRASPRDLLNVDIFFDLVPVHGAAGLAARIRDFALDRARASPAFAKLLAEAAGEMAPPLGLLGRIRTQEGRVDLKRGGLFPIVTLARVLAIRHGLRERGTPARLEALRRLGIGADADLAGLIEAHRLLLGLVLRQQIADIAAGLPPSNRVELSALPTAEQAELREALRRLVHLPVLMRDLLF